MRRLLKEIQEQYKDVWKNVSSSHQWNKEPIRWLVIEDYSLIANQTNIYLRSTNLTSHIPRVNHLISTTIKHLMTWRHHPHIAAASIMKLTSIRISYIGAFRLRSSRCNTISSTLIQMSNLNRERYLVR